MPDPNFTHQLFKLFGASAKTLAVSLVLAVGGFVWHNLMTINEQSIQLQQHQQQLDQLSKNADATHDKVEEISITIARVEGKIDTLGTKIDDDRRVHHAN